MPTRLPVLLHKWKSAWAVPGSSRNAAAASTARTDGGKGKRKRLTCLRTVFWRVSGFGCLGAGIGKPLGSVNDNGAKIIDVGARGACLDEIADPGKKTCGVVVRKKMGRIEAKRTGPFQRGFVDSGPGRVVGRARAAIGAIGVAGQRRNTRRAAQRHGERQGVFLIRAAPALAADRHG